MNFIRYSILAALLPAAHSQILTFESVNVLPMDRNRVLERQTVIVRDGRLAQLFKPVEQHWLQEILSNSTY